MNVSKLKIVYEFIKPYPWHIVVISILILIYAALEGVGLGVLYYVLDSSMASDQSGQKEVLFSGHLERIIEVFPISDKLIAACTFLIIIIGVKNLFGYVGQVFSVWTGYRIWEDNQEKIFKKYITSDYQQFLDNKQGEVVYRIYTAPNYLGFLLSAVPQVLTEGIRILIITFVLFSLTFQMSLMIITFCFLYYLFTQYIAKNISYNLGKGRTEASQRQNVLITEMFNGARQIKLFSAEKRWIDEFFKAMRKYFSLAIKDSMWLYMPRHSLDFVFISGLAGILIYVQLTNPMGLYAMFPVLGIFAYGFLRIMPSLNIISTNWIQLANVLPNLEILHSVLNKNMHEIEDGKVELTSFNDAIVFNDVTFGYPRRGHVLKNFSMRIEKGKQTALVGPSGVGKTTVFDLIIRLFDPNEGTITIDGTNLKDIKITTWLKKIGYVSQDTFIFNATIAENISFGSKEASHEEVVNAAQEANAHEFISQFPDGYETIVGDRGLKLSGGQRQRIAIARALVRKPEILILDEATSALDSAAEAQVQDAINKVAQNRTVIMIAHRLSTVKNADVIYVLEDGNIIESGSHDQLLKADGKYRRYHDTQLKTANIGG